MNEYPYGLHRDEYYGDVPHCFECGTTNDVECTTIDGGWYCEAHWPTHEYPSTVPPDAPRSPSGPLSTVPGTSDQTFRMGALTVTLPPLTIPEHGGGPSGPMVWEELNLTLTTRFMTIPIITTTGEHWVATLDLYRGTWVGAPIWVNDPLKALLLPDLLPDA